MNYLPSTKSRREHRRERSRGRSRERSRGRSHSPTNSRRERSRSPTPRKKQEREIWDKRRLEDEDKRIGRTHEDIELLINQKEEDNAVTTERERVENERRFTCEILDLDSYNLNKKKIRERNHRRYREKRNRLQRWKLEDEKCRKERLEEDQELCQKRLKEDQAMKKKRLKEDEKCRKERLKEDQAMDTKRLKENEKEAEISANHDFDQYIQHICTNCKQVVSHPNFHLMSGMTKMHGGDMFSSYKCPKFLSRSRWG